MKRTLPFSHEARSRPHGFAGSFWSLGAPGSSPGLRLGYCFVSESSHMFTHTADQTVTNSCRENKINSPNKSRPYTCPNK